MKTRILLGVCAVTALSFSGVMAGGIKSSLPEGKKVSAFSPLNITGKFAGAKRCLV